MQCSCAKLLHACIMQSYILEKLLPAEVKKRDTLSNLVEAQQISAPYAARERNFVLWLTLWSYAKKCCRRLSRNVRQLKKRSGDPFAHPASDSGKVSQKVGNPWHGEANRRGRSWMASRQLDCIGWSRPAAAISASASRLWQARARCIVFSTAPASRIRPFCSVSAWFL